MNWSTSAALWVSLGMAALAQGGEFRGVAPRSIPNIPVTTSKGLVVPLQSLLASKQVVLQLMYTRCKKACPLTGGMFREVDRNLAAREDVVLLSITVDPENDTPADLVAWRNELTASARWHVVRASRGELVQLLGVLGEVDCDPGGHSRRVFFLDGRGTRVAYVGFLADPVKASQVLSKLSD